MDYEPDLQLIYDLIEASYVDTAIKELDKLLKIHAVNGEVKIMHDILEGLHVSYLDIEPIGYRLMLLRKRLGMEDYQDGFFDT